MNARSFQLSAQPGVRTPGCAYSSKRLAQCNHVARVISTDNVVSDVSEPSCSFTDPEAKLRRYGRHFGQNFKINMEEWMDAAPRVRVRKAAQRPVNDILELAVLNERLAGSATPWEARQKLEYLKMRRRNWERIYEYVIKQDAAATLAVIEEASDKVCAWKLPTYRLMSVFWQVSCMLYAFQCMIITWRSGCCKVCTCGM